MIFVSKEIKAVYKQKINTATIKMNWYNALTTILIPFGIVAVILQTIAQTVNTVSTYYFNDWGLYYSIPYNSLILLPFFASIFLLLVFRKQLYCFGGVLPVFIGLAVLRLLTDIVSDIILVSLYSNETLISLSDLLFFLFYFVPNFIYFYKRRFHFQSNDFVTRWLKEKPNKYPLPMQSSVVVKRDQTKICPACGAMILFDSINCADCGALLDDSVNSGSMT